MWPTLTLAILVALAAGGVAAVLWRRRTLARHAVPGDLRRFVAAQQSLHTIKDFASPNPAGGGNPDIREFVTGWRWRVPVDPPVFEQPVTDCSSEQSAEADVESRELRANLSAQCESLTNVSGGSEDEDQPHNEADSSAVELPPRVEEFEGQFIPQRDQGNAPQARVPTPIDVPVLVRSELESERSCSHGGLRAELESDDDEGQRYASMRITKRSSGGRGEYEISESFNGITPRDLLDRTIVLDFGSGVEIATGVRLLLRHGKRRLRIDEKAGCEMHLHRQLAAVLMLPHPVREESKWAPDTPVIQSGLYGIKNIALSSVMLSANGIARVAVASVTVSNLGGEDQVQGPERMAEVKRLWEQHAGLPSLLASLVAEHKRLIEAGGPLGVYAEEVVSKLQDCAAEHCQAQGLSGFSPSHDVFPLLVRLFQSQRPLSDIGTPPSENPSLLGVSTANAAPSIGEAATNKATETASPLLEPASDESSIVTNPEIGADIDNTQLEADAPDLETAHEISVELEQAAAEAEAIQSGEEASRIRTPPSPRRYRPQPRGPVVTTRSPSGSTPPGEQRDVSVPIDLRLRSRVGGTYILSFLPRRRIGMPPELEVLHSDQRIQLSAPHEDWYQDVFLPEAGNCLRDGLAWRAEGSTSSFRWSLAGREVFVLGTRDDLSGFVSVPRLILGAQHVVICREHVLQRVLAVLRESCGIIPTSFGESDGLPSDWVGIGPVVPTVPLPPSEAGDILDALRPDPAVVIALEGGIRLQHNQFLGSYPPQVRVYGSIPAHAQVLIDGRPADAVGNAFTTTGFDLLGEHVVSCGAVSRTYAVVAPDDGWESWSAFSFSLHAQRGAEASASICGARVTEAGKSVLLVPSTTPVLLGSQPGEIYVAPVRQDLRTSVCPAFPLFTPVWAVPRDPLRSDKRTARVALLKEHSPAVQGGRVLGLAPSSMTLKWCIAILDCCRKGLSVEPAGHDARELWRSYRELARSLWRASR